MQDHMTSEERQPTRRHHFGSNANPETATIDCAECGPGVPAAFRAHRGKWVCVEANRKKNAARQTPESRRRTNLARNFGLTVEQYDAMAEAQGGVCAICGEACSRGYRLAVDHDHETGVIRGLLCSKCNRALGLFGDGTELLLRALNYLQAGSSQ